MGQFSGGCYLSFGILVLLGSRVPATLARGKRTQTLFKRTVFTPCGASVAETKLEKRGVCAPEKLFEAGLLVSGF
ncbi:hypothetical protein KUCAC02_008533 [Chaenocephalus aceratus]|uniref:Uncharacterized protein n=1 Tax=Chaenocephalus aceratus TaxID=36190 RepID=A0ACB9WQS4_CHAAC|nr:hypothetical protein KUCAC02_008533 [Chaenocephalus aceratus]